MALPNSNISISMVRNELGETSNDLSVLCKSDNINKWSKWKPVNNSVVTNTQATLAAFNYGITAPTQYNSPQLLHTALLSTTFYNYQKPEMYRLGDFRNYEKNSYLPAGSGIEFGTVKTINKTLSSPISYFMFTESFESYYSVGKQFIEDAVGYELFQCVVIKINDKYYWTSSEGAIAWDWSSTGGIGGLSGYSGDATIFYCYCNVNFNNVIQTIVTNGAHRFIPIPVDIDNVNPFPALITNNTPPPTNYTTSAFGFDTGKKLTASLILDARAPGMTGGTSSRWTAMFWNGNPADGASETLGDVTLIDPAITVNAGTKVERSEDLSYRYDYYTKDKWVIFYRNGLEYSRTACGMAIDPDAYAD